ncbi:MAG: efflux RND transporter periplasmic adaptor subunit [candidate division NC10 bacterium]|nr:efflux RND transporter periplasmic adaptor subunit [candidate division NC10 bacterium]MDE2321205.1 efflux RND transporter periplasmic adaptor subunit [candidate division NC10 bacterium]MDE2484150.1 efflux RND transporter periplasmic adaptor subunit [candidate division NC10 bacterium]
MVQVKQLVSATLLAIAVAAGGCGKQETAPASHETGKVAHPPGSEEHRHDHAPHDEERRETVGPGEAPIGVRLTPEERENIGLRTEVVQLRPVEDVRKLNGIVKPHPDRLAQVTSRVPGIVLSVHASLGAWVRRGDDLLDIKSVELERLELSLIQAENRLALTKLDLERVRQLVEREIVARKELLALENRHRETLNEIESLTRQLNFLGLPQQAITRIREEQTVATLHLPAPIGGTIVERNVVIGQAIEPNVALMRIIDASIMIVEGEAFEDILPMLKLGQKVRVVVAAYPDEVFEGKISFISPTVNPIKRTIPVWAEVINRRGLLKQDLFTQVYVIVGEKRRSLTIPVEALISAEGSEFTFVERGGVYLRADLGLGTRNDRFAEVTRGLTAGDRVVTDGSRQLYTKWLTAQGGGSALGGHTH